MELFTSYDHVMETLGISEEYRGAMSRLLDCLQYPVAPDGTVFDSSLFGAVAAYHLARCGFDVARTPLIQKRPVSGPGIIVGACEWVSTDEDASPVTYSSPISDLENMTIAQIDALPEPLRREARQKLGLPYEEPGWNQKPEVSIEDAPDMIDGAEWTAR